MKALVRGHDSGLSRRGFHTPNSARSHGIAPPARVVVNAGSHLHRSAISGILRSWASSRCLLSDNWLRVIPTDPTFVPSAQAAQRGVHLLARLAPAGASGEPAHEVHFGKTVFVDAGANFESVTCPWCGMAILLEQWQDWMGAAASTEFTQLNVRTRCCDVTTSLNELRYDWPQGFARWWLEVMNPTAQLSDTQIEVVAEAIGHPVRVVWAHY